MPGGRPSTAATDSAWRTKRGASAGMAASDQPSKPASSARGSGRAAYLRTDERCRIARARDARSRRGSSPSTSPRRPTRPAEQRRLRDKRVHGLYAHMQRVITTEYGAALYRRRQQMIEPIFAQTEVTRRANRFQRRGLKASRSEWRLIAATHNLLKLYRHA